MSDDGICGCCAGDTTETPQQKGNPPGLPAITYRAGTYATFKSSLLSSLSKSGHPALARLTTRRDDDWTIGLCDAMATLGDVLTFYQERIANEAFLRTATERRSILELARLVGYRLAPGVAASTSLAFTLDTSLAPLATAPLPVTIPAGTRLQSVPGDNELPQTFETTAPIVARPEWNALLPQSSIHEHPYAGQTSLWLRGTATLLQPGDAIAFVSADRRNNTDSEKWQLRWITAVQTDNTRALTRIEWNDGLEKFSAYADPDVEGVEIYALRQRTALFGNNAVAAVLFSITLPGAVEQIDGEWFWKNYAAALTSPIDLEALYPRIVAGSWLGLCKGDTRQLYKATKVQQRSKAAFGLAGKVTEITLDTSLNLENFDRPNTSVFAQSEIQQLADRPLFYPLFGSVVALDSEQPGLARAQRLAIRGKRQRIAALSDASGVTFPDDPARIALPKESFLVLAAPVAVIGGTESAIQPADLDVYPQPTKTLRWRVLDRQGVEVTVQTQPGGYTLESAWVDDLVVQEVISILDQTGAVVVDRDRTTLTIQAPLQNCYDRSTVTLNANVAPATNGETVGEIAGSGQASTASQRFQLRQSPLTYVPAKNPRGCESTLKVLANDLVWTEVSSLYSQPPTARVYALRQDDGGNTIVQFGDGIEGARLPTGTDNVRMSYRKGLGIAGNVRADTITSLVSRPLGVKAATNPVGVVGGQDAESPTDARRNAPRTVLTLDRAVSILDYEDFSRSFAGISKAVAAWIPAGRSQGVHITAAAAGGLPIGPGSDPYDALLDSLRLYGDNLLPLTLKSFVPATFVLQATVKVLPQYVVSDVLAAVATQLRSDFSFDARDFGQVVSIDEVMASMHSVEGVLAVDINALHRTDTPPGPQPEPRLFPAPATIQADGAVTAAELLTLDPDGLQLGVMS